MTPLQNFRIARYHVILTALSTISMPPYAGSTLRGGFGHAFRKMVCTQGPIDCRDCTLKAVCPYPYIFETAPFEGAQQLRTYGDVPRPFVIDPLSTRGEYPRGESFVFRLTLIGRAIDYLPYFLVSFRELGETGIGKGRGRFHLTQVLTEDGESIYDGDTQMVHNRDNALSFDEIQQEAESLPNDVLTVHLLTPTRITHKGQITDELPFHLFWRRLIGRISALGYFHCGESLSLDFKGLIAQAEKVSARRQKRNVWVGEVPGWIRRRDKVGIALVATILKRGSYQKKVQNTSGKPSFSAKLGFFAPFLNMSVEKGEKNPKRP